LEKTERKDQEEIRAGLPAAAVDERPQKKVAEMPKPRKQTLIQRSSAEIATTHVSTGALETAATQSSNSRP